MPARTTPAATAPQDPGDNLALLLAQHEQMSCAWRQQLQLTLAGLEELEAQRQAMLAAAAKLGGLGAASDRAGANPEQPLPTLPALLATYERILLHWALLRTGGNQKEAASLLGIRNTTLHEKLKRLGLARPRERSAGQDAWRERSRYEPVRRDQG